MAVPVPFATLLPFRNLRPRKWASTIGSVFFGDAMRNLPSTLPSSLLPTDGFSSLDDVFTTHFLYL